MEPRLNIYRVIAKYQQEHPNSSPSVREICTLAGISSTSVVKYHLNIMVDEQMITRVPGQTRNIRLLPTCLDCGRSIDAEQAANYGVCGDCGSIYPEHFPWPVTADREINSLKQWQAAHYPLTGVHYDPDDPTEIQLKEAGQ